mgnify:CR=1 FL=1
MLLNNFKETEISPVTDYTTNNAVQQLFSTVNRKIAQDNPFYSTHLNASSSIFWLSLNPDCPAKFTPELVSALRGFQRSFKSQHTASARWGMEKSSPEYFVLTSEIDDTFNLGGDLPYFFDLIKKGDREQLNKYARDCVELVYQNSVAMDLPMTTIALVKGTAMGGGMEAALSANVLVAEKQVKMGLPEVLFNMFPGMGAYQFLSRKLTPVQAEKMIMSGRTYEAEELYEMGIIDVLADEGKGEQAVYDYVARHRRTGHAGRALRRAMQAADPISRESLLSVVDIWVETAMTLGERDLGHMQYLIRAQQNRGF